MTNVVHLCIVLFHLHAAKYSACTLQLDFLPSCESTLHIFLPSKSMYCVCACVFFFFLSLSRLGFFFVLHRVFSPSLTSATKHYRQAKEIESMCITFTSRASFSCEKKTYLDETKQTES